jgi:hypothetical protein
LESYARREGQAHEWLEARREQRARNLVGLDRCPHQADAEFEDDPTDVEASPSLKAGAWPHDLMVDVQEDRHADLDAALKPKRDPPILGGGGRGKEAES